MLWSLVCLSASSPRPRSVWLFLFASFGFGVLLLEDHGEKDSRKPAFSGILPFRYTDRRRSSLANVSDLLLRNNKGLHQAALLGCCLRNAKFLV